MQGLTQQACAELAAATDGALFWTYKSFQNRCYVKKTNGGRRYQLYAGLVSGNRECGVTGEDHLHTLNFPFSGNSGQITVSNQKDYKAAMTSCIKQCNARVTEIERVYVGIRRIDIYKFECKCLSRDSGDIIGRPSDIQWTSDVRQYVQCDNLITSGISSFNSDSTLKKYLTESLNTLRTSDGQWEGTEPNICNSSQVEITNITNITNIILFLHIPGRRCDDHVSCQISWPECENPEEQLHLQHKCFPPFLPNRVK